MVKKEKALGYRVVRFIQEQNLISSGEKLVIAVSGGADSVFLLHIMAQYQKELEVELCVAHLNHQLRGTESDSDAKYVSNLSHHLGIPSIVERRDVAAYRKQKGCSLEEAAREIRYSFLADVARAIGTHKIAVGHTCDDQAETIILHLLRGAGTAGLRGLQPLSPLEYRGDNEQMEIVRPLLEITRQETLDYCGQHHLKPRSDSSNESPAFFRNRIRLELLPMLKNYNPSVDKALLRLAAIAGDDVSFIEEKALQLWAEVIREEANAIYLDKAKIANQPRALRRQIFRLAITQLLGSLRDIEADHIEAMMSYLSMPAGKMLSLPYGLVLSTQYENLVLSLPRASLCPLPLLEGEFNLNIPGETALPGWQVKANVLQEVVASNEDAFVASFDLDKVGRELKVRQRKPGDRFQPLGMNQPKKLQDFMVDAKIPRAWRGRVPLVCSPQQILWVVGWRIDDKVRVTEATEQVLQIGFQKIS